MSNLSRRAVIQAMASAAALPVVGAPTGNSPGHAPKPGPGAVPVVDEIVQERFQPLPFESQVLEGILSDRMRINVECRLLRIDEQALLSGFSTPDAAGDSARAWEGEHVGKFLDAACNAVRHRDNAPLRARMDRIVKGLVALQGADGYLGTYSAERRWTGWDVWVHKYNLIGLLSYYELAGDPAVLACCRKMGDLLDGTFGDAPGKRDIVAAGDHIGMAATSVLEPMCKLYRFTGEPRHLAFCKYIVRAYDGPEGPRIVSALLEKGSVYSTANGKAYELLSNLNGLVDLHRLTGDDKLLAAVLRGWDDIVRHQLYFTGSMSAREHFQPADRLLSLPSSNVGEMCVTVTWLQLNWRLLRLTGETRFAQELERSVYNHLLAAQHSSNGNISYYTSLVGRKEHTDTMLCCTSSGPRGISLIPRLAWGLQEDAFVIHLYTAGRAHFEIDTVPVEVLSQTRFPLDGDITLTINPQRAVAFTVRLRVPEWATRFEVTTESHALAGRAGQMLDIDRTWRPSSKVKIRMDLPTRVLRGAPAYPEYVALQRGPQVLALEKAVNPDVPYLQRVEPLDESASPMLKAAAVPSGWLGRQLYEMDATVGLPAAADQLHLEKRKLLLVPFADAINYRVWLTPAHKMRRDVPAVTGFARARLSVEKMDARAIEGGHGAADIAEYLVDENPGTFCTTDPRDPSLSAYLGAPEGKRGDLVWYSIWLDGPQLISRIVFRHGPMTAAGGWFDSSETKPYIEVARMPVPLFRNYLSFPMMEQAGWDKVAQFDVYPATDGSTRPRIAEGQVFEVRLPQPIAAHAIRLVGKSAGDYTSCAELSAYA